jgi:bifunctional UDP-N-acetylglucosamine pyrophosphorylase/glucosamine-1-phosphate N-acetyltransferase
MESRRAESYLEGVQEPVAVVLAAGKGTRMRADLPKVLLELGGEPLVFWPIRAARAAGAASIVVVVGFGAQLVRARVGEEFPGAWVRFAQQSEQRGTGHAVLCALPLLEEHRGPVLVLSGDTPLLRPQTLVRLLELCTSGSADLALVTFQPASTAGYGRIVRDEDGAIVRIVEERDATDTQRAIRECNAGVYCVQADRLREELPKLGSANAQGEIYLTDLVERLAGRGRVCTVTAAEREVAGVNTEAQLHELARSLQD